MIDPTTAAYVFSALTVVVVFFQLALALGAPWGEMAMGGKYPGRFPPQLRVAALVQAVLLLSISLVVLVRSGLVLDALFEFSKSAIWFVVAICMVGAVLNTITPSKKERMLWAPIAIVLLFCAAVVAGS
jgi:cytochrome bd-type quinol oxidase subunit 2